MNNKYKLLMMLLTILSVVVLCILSIQSEEGYVNYSTSNDSTITVQRVKCESYKITTYDDIIGQTYVDYAESKEEAMEAVEHYKAKLEGLD